MMKFRIFEFSFHWAFFASPVEHIPLVPEEILPVVSDIGDNSTKTPHISRGGDMRVISSQNLRSEITDCADCTRGAVVHSGWGLTYVVIISK